VDTWVCDWLLIAILSTILAIAVLVALVRHVLVVGRTAREFQDAVRPMVDEVSRQSNRATQRASRTRATRLGGRP